MRATGSQIYFFFRFLQCLFFEDAARCLCLWRRHFLRAFVFVLEAGPAGAEGGCWQAGAAMAGLDGTILSTTLPLVT